MKYQSIRLNAVLSLLIVILFAKSPGTTRAGNLVLGDLFAARPGTSFNSVSTELVALQLNAG